MFLKSRRTLKRLLGNGRGRYHSWKKKMPQTRTATAAFRHTVSEGKGVGAQTSETQLFGAAFSMMFRHRFFRKQKMPQR